MIKSLEFEGFNFFIKTMLRLNYTEEERRKSTLRPLISLDVFDTALFRDVFYPTDLFNVVEKEVGNNFKKLRIEAQTKASRLVGYCNIIDIYKQIPQFSMAEEIKAEMAGCRANPYILNMYNTEDADFIFISDMYLPSNVITAMLKKCGYVNPVVFVSCDLKAVKGDGRLFTEVEKRLGRKISKHIGDNYFADIDGAKKAKIPEVEYIGPSIYNKEVITPVLDDVRLRKFLIDNELSDKSIEEKIGYIFAPLTLAFTKKVLDEARDNQTIFFNARDGFLMYIIARWILKTKKKIKYCRFSRKSCFLSDFQTSLPITHPNNRSALQFLKVQRIKTLRDFLKVFNFSENKDFSSLFRKFQINLDSDIEFHPNKFFIIESLLVLFQSDVYEKAKKEKNCFIKYAKNLGMKDNDIFVDIGYNGTIQGVIKRITGIDLKGRYIYTFNNQRGQYCGVIYEKKSFLTPKSVNFVGGAVVEMVYTEPAGTVIGYSDIGKPILLRDLKIRKDISKKLLKGVLRGCKELYEKNIDISHEDCEKLLGRYLEFPTLEEAEFGNQNIFENGSSENESIVWFNKDLIRKGMIKDCYNRSYWKPAFKLLLLNDVELKHLKNKII